MSKTILEKALLEAEQLEETMKSNAKEILSSTMKEEIHELVKESLSENDYLEEQEDEEEVAVDLDVEDLEDEADEVDSEEPEMDIDLELGMEDDTEDDEVSLELPPLDLTLASDAEVLKVFKAMGDEDGIIIQQDDEEIELTDTNTDTEYLIKLEQSKKSKTMKEEKSMKNDEVEETTDNKEMDEVVYEIELDEEMYEGDVEGVYAPESKRAQKSYDSYLDRTNIEEKDDSEVEEEMHEEMHEDDMEEEMHEDQGIYDREHESMGMRLGKGHDTQGDSYGKWGNRKKDHEKDWGHINDAEDVENKEEVDETSRLKAGPNSSFSRMAGQKIWGKNKESRRPRKANLGESRIRKSYNLLKEEVESLKTKNEEYKTALVTFKDKLNEVGVFNSNLAYVTRLFTEHSTTKQEKINILKRFDNVKTLKESKVLYKVIKEEFSQDVEDKSKTISEAVERKITKSSTSGSGGKLLESKVYENPQFSRMKDLMSKL